MSIAPRTFSSASSSWGGTRTSIGDVWDMALTSSSQAGLGRFDEPNRTRRTAGLEAEGTGSGLSDLATKEPYFAGSTYTRSPSVPGAPDGCPHAVHRRGLAPVDEVGRNVR